MRSAVVSVLFVTLALTLHFEGQREYFSLSLLFKTILITRFLITMKTLNILAMTLLNWKIYTNFVTLMVNWLDPMGGLYERAVAFAEVSVFQYSYLRPNLHYQNHLNIFHRWLHRTPEWASNESEISYRRRS